MSLFTLFLTFLVDEDKPPKAKKQLLEDEVFEKEGNEEKNRPKPDFESLIDLESGGKNA